MNGLSKDSVNWLSIDEAVAGQRLDNFLARILKGVPKSHIYRILRSGEVRVNSRRADPTLRLKSGDQVRVPPVRLGQKADLPAPAQVPDLPVLFEDSALLAVDKPSGVAVHGGSGISSGVIESLRYKRPDARFLELVHRLDRDTSGVLMLAKKRSALLDLHSQIREGRTDKRYLALVRGRWEGGAITIDAPLRKYLLSGGERRVQVDSEGQSSRTIVRSLVSAGAFSLVEARLMTGRTHQIRVHLAHVGKPICGDDKYGDPAINKELARLGLKRMFLHALQFRCRHPVTGDDVTVRSDLPPELDRLLRVLRGIEGAGAMGTTA